MPSISDLKNDGNNGADTEVTKEPFVPYVKQEDDTTEQGGFMPHVIQEPQPEAPVRRRKGSIMSMGSGKDRGIRESANFDNLPDPETPGVEIKESPQKEIFKPGGDFDQFLESKKAEFDNFMSELEEEAEMNGKTLVTKEEYDKLMSGELTPEELEASRNADNNAAKEINTVDVFADEPMEAEYDPMEEEEVEEYDPVLEVEHETNNIDIFADEDIEEENINMNPEETFVVEDTIEEEINEEAVEYTHVEEIEPALPEVEEVEDTPAIEIAVEKQEYQIGKDDSDEDEIDADVSNDSEADAAFESLKKQITEKIKPVSMKLDISGFTVASKPDMSNAIIQTSKVNVSKWVLPSTGVTVMMQQLLGADLEKLRTLMTGNDSRATLQLVYDNIVSPKPSFEAWLKTTAFDDYDHLFMAIYIAAFNGANYMPIDCTNEKCPEKSYITDNIPFTSLIKYKDNEAKKKFQKLYQEEPVEVKGLRVTEVIPISKDYAVGLTIPSLYSVMVEDGYYDPDFRRKYSSAISIAPYVDKFYSIDWENKRIVPIGYKSYENNDAKTAKSRITKFAKIIATLSNDEITSLRAHMDAVNVNSDMITYIQPETQCPHCKKVNPEITEGISASSMLFLRCQLGLLVNT